VWEAFIARAKDRDPALSMVILDGTNIRAHNNMARAAETEGVRRNEAIVRHLAASAKVLAARPAWRSTGAEETSYPP